MLNQQHDVTRCHYSVDVHVVVVVYAAARKVAANQEHGENVATPSRRTSLFQQISSTTVMSLFYVSAAACLRPARAALRHAGARMHATTRVSHVEETRRHIGLVRRHKAMSRESEVDMFTARRRMSPPKRAYAAAEGRMAAYQECCVEQATRWYTRYNAGEHKASVADTRRRHISMSAHYSSHDS